jgi:hypothetical protein
MTAGDPAIEEPRLDLLLDEARRRADALPDRPRHLGLRGDREVAPDVREERAVRAREVVGVLGEAGHRALALDEHVASVGELGLLADVRVDQVLDGAVDRSRVLIHTRAQLRCMVIHESAEPLLNPASRAETRRSTRLGGRV